MIDWKTIETEYVTTDISHRQLAEKYGIGRSRLSQYASKEKWKEKRDKHRAKTVSKAVNAVSNKQASKLARIDGITDKLLSKLEKAVEELDLSVIKKKTKIDDGLVETTTEVLETEEGGIVDRAGLRHLTAALKDLKEIQMLKSELDRQEQEARIDKLRKEAMVEKENNRPIEVVFAAGPEEWNE